MKKEPKLLNMSSKYNTLQLHLATLRYRMLATGTGCSGSRVTSALASRRVGSYLICSRGILWKIKSGARRTAFRLIANIMMRLGGAKSPSPFVKSCCYYCYCRLLSNQWVSISFSSPIVTLAKRKLRRHRIASHREREANERRDRAAGRVVATPSGGY